MVRDMAHHFDSMSEEGLHRFLTGAAVERGERFVVEQRGGESFAEFRSPSALTGEVVPLGEEGGGLSRRGCDAERKRTRPEDGNAPPRRPRHDARRLTFRSPLNRLQV